ncbi:peptide chain release factor 2 [Candidatus Babeliales bacterium]|nr:peptide chain release factor 2 [Candidatus Babeliales bacterium]MBP9843665.1 peptide chain release factor 2 [Candidatus Babeliales bacterium]
MIIDDLKQEIKDLEPHIIIIKDYWFTAQLEQQFQLLETQSNQEDFWQHPDKTEILQKLQHLKTKRQEYLSITQGYQDIKDLIALFEDDEKELQSVEPELKALIKKAKLFKINLLLNESNDASNCFFTINSGAGGTESQDWAEILSRMYVRFGERNNFSVHIIEQQNGEEAGIKSVTLYIKGNNAYGLLKSEHGVHRLVRISPFDANKRRHTSFAAVNIIPELPPAEKIEIDPKDLRIDTYRAGGAGGQHVNKTDSAVRITHIPSGFVVQCQNERSQHQNKEVAMKMLMSKLKQKQILEEQAKVKTDKQKNEWGSQIRSYVLHPYKMVKDHRTDVESPQPDLVLDGDIMDFIETYLVQQGKN